MARGAGEAGSFRLSAAKFLDEGAVRRNLVLSALYLFAFEVLKTAITEDVKAFLVFDTSNADDVGKYRAQLRDLHQNPWKASCLLLAELGVLNAQDVEDLGRIVSHRNSVAHELPRLLVSEDLDLDVHQLGRMREILAKVDAWRKEFDLLPLYPESEVGEARSVRMILVDMILWDVVSWLEGSTASTMDSGLHGSDSTPSQS